MRKAAGKRMPHGATSDLVLAVLWNIHIQTGRPKPVWRDELVRAVPLPETTVDDRLRVLVKKGLVMKVMRGLYTPTRKPSWIVDKPPPPDPEPLPKARPPGERKVLIFPGDSVLIERRLSLRDYLRYESARQLDVYTAMGWIPPVEEDEDEI